MRLDLLSALNRARAARQPVLVVTDLADGSQRLVEAGGIAADPLAEVLAERLRTGRSGTVAWQGHDHLVAVHAPPVRLVVIGAVHVSQALAPLAKVVGLDLIIVDPRTAFASPERFPDCRIVTTWPDEALASIGLDAFTAVAALTHDPKIDDPGLAAALRSDCFYIGALGSRKTHAGRCERLTAQGIPLEALARIHAPIGLDIGAVSPAEIAVSILGEVILARRRKPTRAEARQGAVSA